jgi:hypothetical protein
MNTKTIIILIVILAFLIISYYMFRTWQETQVAKMQIEKDKLAIQAKGQTTKGFDFLGSVGSLKDIFGDISSIFKKKTTTSPTVPWSIEDLMEEEDTSGMT